MSNPNAWVIKDLKDLYEGIPESKFCEIAPHSVDQNLSKGQVIYRPHEKNSNIYVVHRGEVILYHSRNRKRAIFDTLGPGSVFGSFDPASEHPTHYAQTTKNTMLCTTPVNEFLNVISAYPEAMLKLMQKMAMRLQDYELRMGSSIETAVERVYAELLRLHKKRQKSLFTKMIPLQLTHEKIAELTNLNRVTVTRCIKKLKEEGMITIDLKTGVITLNE